MMKTISLLLLLLVTQPLLARENTLFPFRTDGCTMFADGTIKRPKLWRHCCVEHDLRYWFGGDQADLDRTDVRLKDCVNLAAGPVWAQIIYEGVRAGHSSPIKNKTHWSWGWVHERPMTKLHPDESLYVIEELQRLPFDRNYIDRFIELNFPGHHETF